MLNIASYGSQAPSKMYDLRNGRVSERVCKKEQNICVSLTAGCCISLGMERKKTQLLELQDVLCGCCDKFHYKQ